jgi:hypothetical protein
MATVDVITNRSTASEILGKAYFETDTNSFIVYNGIGWVELQSDGTGAVGPYNEYSLDLDGSNDYIDCGGDADFSFTDGAGNDSPFSISAWVKLDSATQARVAGKGNMEWLFGTDSSNQFNLILWSNDGTSAYLQKYSSVLSTGSWHHIAATYDGSNTAAGITLYLAGSSVSSTDGSVGTYAGMASQQGALRIGQWEFNNSVMDGLVDEVAVFNSELSASDVTAIYNSGVPADLTSLSPLGYWRMGDNDSGTGTTITDQGVDSNGDPSGNDGSFGNSPTFVSGSGNTPGN